MSNYKETRRLGASALRALCIRENWYTLGDNDEYEHLLLDLAGNKPHLATGDIIAIAEDIAAHSDLDEGWTVEAIAFEIGRACSVTFQRVPELAEGLPELCFSVLPGAGELICIKRGESGYYPSDWSTDDPERNRELADYNNERLGVTQAQRLAMEAGSMHGWDVPGADPQKAYVQLPHVSDEMVAAAKRAVDRRLLPKLLAVLEAVGCTEPDCVASIASQLDQYVFEPRHRTFEDIALADLHIIVGELALDLLLPHVNLHTYGQAVAKDMRLTLSSYGEISRRDGEPIQTMGEQAALRNKG